MSHRIEPIYEPGRAKPWRCEVVEIAEDGAERTAGFTRWHSFRLVAEQAAFSAVTHIQRHGAAPDWLTKGDR